MELAGDFVFAVWNCGHLAKTLAWMFRNNRAVFRDVYFECVERLDRRKDRFFSCGMGVFSCLLSVVCCEVRMMGPTWAMSNLLYLIFRSHTQITWAESGSVCGAGLEVGNTVDRVCFSPRGAVHSFDRPEKLL